MYVWYVRMTCRDELLLTVDNKEKEPHKNRNSNTGAKSAFSQTSQTSTGL